MSLPNRIFLIRHAESLGNIDKTLYAKIPDHALEITAKGEEQAKARGIELRDELDGQSARFYVSPYLRTRRTAKIITDQLPPNAVDFMTEDWRLREQDWGNLREPEATEQLDKERDAYGTTFYRFPNGESGADVYDRVSTFLSSMWRDFEKKDFPKNVVIVTHGFTLRVFLARWLHWTPEEFESYRNLENCGEVVLVKGIEEEISGVPRYSLATKLEKREMREVIPKSFFTGCSEKVDTDKLTQDLAALGMVTY